MAQWGERMRWPILWERLTEAGRQIAAFVIDPGPVQDANQNQLDPTEDGSMCKDIPGNSRVTGPSLASRFAMRLR